MLPRSTVSYVISPGSEDGGIADPILRYFLLHCPSFPLPSSRCPVFVLVDGGGTTWNSYTNGENVSFVEVLKDTPVLRHLT